MASEPPDVKYTALMPGGDISMMALASFSCHGCVKVEPYTKLTSSPTSTSARQISDRPCPMPTTLALAEPSR